MYTPPTNIRFRNSSGSGSAGDWNQGNPPREGDCFGHKHTATGSQKVSGGDGTDHGSDQLGEKDSIEGDL